MKAERMIELILISSLLVSVASSHSNSDCFQNPPTICPTCGTGKVQELGALNAYVNGPPHSKLAVLMFSDIYGYEAPNFRKVADKVAGAGFLAVAPDLFHGNPVDPNNPNFDRAAWFKNHTADKGYEDAKPVIAALKSKGISAVGAAGFCWGGKVAVKLANSDIKAAVLLHPSNVTVDEINEVKVPLAILWAELDKGLSPEQLKNYGGILSAHKIDHLVKIYPGVKHGWTVRYNATDEYTIKRAEEAHQDMINWFIEYLKRDIK